MSKQLKYPSKGEVTRAENALPEHRGTDEAAKSNAELQERMSYGEEGALAVPMGVVRDVAMPFLERGMLALQVTPHGDGKIDRFIEILDGSRLDPDRKTLLVERLESGENVASGIHESIVRWFGSDSEADRGAIVDRLQAVWAALRGGTEEAVAWGVPEHGSVEMSAQALEGPLVDRAEAMIADVASALLSDDRAGEQLRGFCRDVQLALIWDDEEEEETALSAEDLGPE